MTFNGFTIYDKNIVKYSTALRKESMYENFVAAAIPSPNSQINTANVLLEFDKVKSLLKEGDNADSSIILGCDDTMDFIDDIMSCYKNGDIAEREYDVGLATGFRAKYTIKMERFNSGTNTTIVILRITDKINSNELHYSISIFDQDIKSVCTCINSAADQAMGILEANRKLDKQMIQLKNDMKAEKVHELYFEIYDEHPKLYNNTSTSNLVTIRTYKITARDKESRPLYSFLRNMHLTCVPLVDYRDYGKEFLGCPFVFSDEMIEFGKKFVESKKQDVKATVNERTKSKES